MRQSEVLFVHETSCEAILFSTTCPQTVEEWRVAAFATNVTRYDAFFIIASCEVIDGPRISKDDSAFPSH